MYAKDAAHSRTPFDYWEYTNGKVWKTLTNHPTWFPHVKYRRKPKPININGYEVPEPVREPLECDQEYWTVEFIGADLSDAYTWEGDDIDKRYLKRGVIHLTKEAAVLHAKALLSFTEI